MYLCSIVNYAQKTDNLMERDCMDTTRMKEQLIQLNPREQLAKRYYDQYGKNLSHSQYMLLLQYPETNLPSLEIIHSPAFEAECKRLELHFASQYRKQGLSDQDFIQPDCNIEIEKLLRYVDIPAHRHGFMELVFVLSGTCYHTVDGKCYEQGPGSFTVINSHIKHDLKAASDCLCLTTKVRSDTFLDFHIPNMPYFAVPVSFSCGHDSFMENSFLTIYAQQENEACYHDQIIELLVQAILVHCMQNYRDTMLFMYSGTPEEGRMLEIMNYMFENYQYITLRGLSQHFGYSEPYLCKLFKIEAGTTFTRIIKEFRLKQAAKMLLSTTAKLDAVCDSVGYSDVTQFIRDFKKQYGSTPAKYRKSVLSNE